MIIKNSSKQYNFYNKSMHASRVNFMKSHGIQTFTGELDTLKLNSFLIVWTYWSIKMTEQVEGWIRRAGESCVKSNLVEVGSQLKRHSAQEANHDQMLVADLDYLLIEWNKKYSDQLTTSILETMGMPNASNKYISLHEMVINGSAPYSQVAIEFEIERISVMYGPKMLENVLYVLGSEYAKGLSFLTDHVLLDQGHTKFNADLLERCFKSNANVFELISTGEAALNIYAEFLNQCSNIADKISERAKCNNSNINL